MEANPLHFVEWICHSLPPWPGDQRESKLVFVAIPAPSLTQLADFPLIACRCGR
jgi:hypothetical protein